MLSIVVVVHDMAREAPRTLRSLGPELQHDLVDEDYEIIVVDNGSSTPLVPDVVRGLGGRYRCHYHATSAVSPAAAVNLGAGMSDGDLLAVIVDGARMASPGLVGQSQRAAAVFEHPFVVSLSWHLGPRVQNESMLDGYDQAEEDALLDRIRWPADGYQLFSVSSLAPSSKGGFLGGVPAECSWWTMRRDDFESLGGFDERFTSPGGGLVNHDFRDRAVSLPAIRPVVLLGEGVFHQFHGGVATNVRREDHPIADFRAEYESIRGRRYRPAPTPSPLYFGTLPEVARRFALAPGPETDQPGE